MRGYINLGFYQGAVLADPQRLLEGTGKGLRHAKIRSLAEANRPLFGRWCQRHSPVDVGVSSKLSLTAADGNPRRRAGRRVDRQTWGGEL